MHKIKKVEPDSIAYELGLESGDFLLSINGQKIADVLDYRFMVQEEELILEVEKHFGESWELEIEKGEFDELGIVFESGLMDKPWSCRNSCIFCFMDQLPKGMRSSLYFKDDDPRLSFLSGNYVTLSNLKKADVERIARYHLSPLHISVHAVESALRSRMLRHPAAEQLFEQLYCFCDAGISMHFQIVLCKGINDGPALDYSIDSLLALGESALSLSVVPVGLTKFRQGLYPLLPFTKGDALGVIEQVGKWQDYARYERGNSFVYCADEWYIKAGLAMPGYEHYEDFPQLENGVGMWTLFEQEFIQAMQLQTCPATNSRQAASGAIGIVSGQAAKALMEKLLPLVPVQTKIYSIRNDFFGDSITVSGLLTGRDVVKQIGEKARQDSCRGIFLPGNMFRAESEQTLDDMTRSEIEQKLGVPIWIGDTRGAEFAKQLSAKGREPHHESTLS